MVVLDEMIWAAELSSAHVEAGPPKMVGSSKEASTETVPEDGKVTITEVARKSEFRIIVAVPADERVTTCAIKPSLCDYRLEGFEGESRR